MRLPLLLSVYWSVVSTAPLAAIPEDDPSRFQYYTMKTPSAGPCDLANGPDGLIWGEDVRLYMLANHVVHVADLVSRF